MILEEGKCKIIACKNMKQMKWKKLGKVFDPTEHRLANNCLEFAQAPQALVFADFVRVYFSTRERDVLGKYVSHISFVDFDKGFKTIRNISDKTVVSLGELGCFDEHGIFPMNVLRKGERILAYTGGLSRRKSVSIEGAIGFVESEDGGTTFKKYGNGPVLAASLHEPFLIADPFVMVVGDVFYMWYIYGKVWKVFTDEGKGERVYKIAQARSSDGLAWERDGIQIIKNVLNEDECQALPTVIKVGERYHMYFCYRQANNFREVRESAYRIGYASSLNLKDWERDDSLGGIDVSTEGWDSEMVCYPHIFHCDNAVYMLYNGNVFGRFGFGLAVLEN